jgi:hypothetical protein
MQNREEFGQKGHDGSRKTMCHGKWQPWRFYFVRKSANLFLVRLPEVESWTSASGNPLITYIPRTR